MSVHPGKHKVGKLPLSILILCRQDHKNELGLKELESEYFWDRILEVQARAARNLAKLYTVLPRKEIDRVGHQELFYLALAVAHQEVRAEDKDYKPNVRFYKKYFKERGLYH